MTQNNMVGIRDYLRGLGFKNEQIDWNPETGMVQIDNKDFLKPASLSDGKSYDSISNIMSQLQATGLYQPTNNYQSQMNNLLSQLVNRINTPFEYDPTNDPRYKAAKKAAERNAQIASKNAMEQLNSRGILNSTITSDRLGQIEQQAQQQVTDLIPQLMQSAYSQRQSELSNLLNLLGAYQTMEQNQLEQQRYEEELARQEQLRELETKQQAFNNALNKVQLLGYVDNESAKILGVPPGTPSYKALQQVSKNSSESTSEQPSEQSSEQLSTNDITTAGDLINEYNKYVRNPIFQELPPDQQIAILDEIISNIENDPEISEFAKQKAIETIRKNPIYRFKGISDATNLEEFTENLFEMPTTDVLMYNFLSRGK